MLRLGMACPVTKPESSNKGAVAATARTKRFRRLENSSKDRLDGTDCTLTGFDGGYGDEGPQSLGVPHSRFVIGNKQTSRIEVGSRKLCIRSSMCGNWNSISQWAVRLWPVQLRVTGWDFSNHTQRVDRTFRKRVSATDRYPLSPIIRYQSGLKTVSISRPRCLQLFPVWHPHEDAAFHLEILLHTGVVVFLPSQTPRGRLVNCMNSSRIVWSTTFYITGAVMGDI